MQGASRSVKDPLSSLSMRGKVGQCWGKVITKETANEMRMKGLRVRRFNAAERLKRRILREIEQQQPSKHDKLRGPVPPIPNASRTPHEPHSETVVQREPLGVPAAGTEIAFGYQLAHGVFAEAARPAPLNLRNRIIAMEQAELFRLMRSRRTVISRPNAEVR